METVPLNSGESDNQKYLEYIELLQNFDEGPRFTATTKEHKKPSKKVKRGNKMSQVTKKATTEPENISEVNAGQEPSEQFSSNQFQSLMGAMTSIKATIDELVTAKNDTYATTQRQMDIIENQGS